MSRETRLKAAIALDSVIVVVQVVLGLVAHSLGLLADAGHNLTDVAAVHDAVEDDHSPPAEAPRRNTSPPTSRSR